MGTDLATVRGWFVDEVLPLEPALKRFLHRHCENRSEVQDIRQEVYVRLLEAAEVRLPRNTQAFMFSVARNYLIDRARRARIVRFDQLLDLEGELEWDDPFSPEQQVGAREEVRRLEAALAALPKRCREVIQRRRIFGLSQKETAAELGISVKAVEQQTTKGMRFLVDAVLGGAAAETPGRPPAAFRPGRLRR